MNLSAYLVPLLALILGAGAIIDEKRRGVLDLVLVYPISTGEYFTGVFVGQYLALAAALVISYVPTGIVLHFAVGANAVEFLLLLGSGSAAGCRLPRHILSGLHSGQGPESRNGLVAAGVDRRGLPVFDLVLVGGLVLYPGPGPGGSFRTVAAAESD